MPYSEILIHPMRQDLLQLGFEETKTPEQVDAVINQSSGTVMIVVNSVCGCAAGKARPGIAIALQQSNKPDRLATVFAGGDIEATERARSYFRGYRPSSPSIALLKNGQIVFMLERHEIEGRDEFQVAEVLKNAFDQHCAESVAATN
jgi:putative YphP/YqiW family bacilliredoxin